MRSAANPRTSSLSRNKFFDAPSQDDECKSFGVQTTPSDMATTVIGRVKVPAGSSPGSTDNVFWKTFGNYPSVPIHR